MSDNKKSGNSIRTGQEYEDEDEHEHEHEYEIDGKYASTLTTMSVPVKGETVGKEEEEGEEDDDEELELRRVLALSLMKVDSNSETQNRTVTDTVLSSGSEIITAIASASADIESASAALSTVMKNGPANVHTSEAATPLTSTSTSTSAVMSTSKTIPNVAPSSISDSATSKLKSTLPPVKIQCTQYDSQSIIEFHQLMWDPTLTTEPDQLRWIRQGIDVQQQQPHYDTMTDIDTYTRTDTENATSATMIMMSAMRTTSDSTTNTSSTSTVSGTGTGSNSVTMANVEFFENQNQTHASAFESAKPDLGLEPEPEEFSSAFHSHESLLLQQLAQTHLPWGLVQDHGGPCGVLAAVQAEMLRILLFRQQIHHHCPQYHNDFNKDVKSEQLGNGSAFRSVTSPETIQSALAGAIAYVLARAALTPSAVASNENESTITASADNNDCDDTLTMSQKSKTGTCNDDNPNSSIPVVHQQRQPTGTVKVVLPIHAIDTVTNNALDWDDLQPWSIGDAGARHVDTSSLRVYTIQCQCHNTTPGTINNINPTTSSISDGENMNVNCEHSSNMNNIVDPSSTAKRQKIANRLRLPQQQHDLSLENTMVGGSIDDDENDDYDESPSLTMQIQALADSVQQFLLEPVPTLEDTSRCTSVARTRPLDYFRNHGGVLLLVMSIVESRGASVLKEEFDDVTGCRLTSNFGHCSQELINMFLTGQAVSNVFDNTLTPVGMVCRGIQSRPMIGYLTQLEAMRYCEVGSYYKSPKVPIWVVGSTSHFTVLFSNRTALKETKSDILLEQCRRAFKSVDAEENGFIATAQFATVFQKLESTIKRKKRKNKDSANGSNNISSTEVDIDPVKIQALAAALEVTGADIILWDDFWKATSRLMMGASFESVILKINSDTTGTVDDEPIFLGSTANTTVAAQGDSSTKHHQALETNMFGNQDKYNSDEDNNNNGPPLLITNYPDTVGADLIVGETDEQMARRLQREWEQESSTTATTITTATTSASTIAAAGTEAVARVGSPMDIDNAQFYHDTVTAATVAASVPDVMISDEELARKLQAEWDAEISGIASGDVGTVATPSSFFGGTSSAAGDVSSVVALSGSPSQYQSSSSHEFALAPATPPRTIGVRDVNMSTVAEEDCTLDFDHDMMNCNDSLKPAARESTINSAATEKMNSTKPATASPEGVTNISTNEQHANNGLEFEKYGDSFTLYHYNGLRGGVLTPFQLTRLTSDEAVGSSIALRRSGGGTGVSTDNDVINIAQDLEDVVRTKWPSCVLKWPNFAGLAPID